MLPPVLLLTRGFERNMIFGGIIFFVISLVTSCPRLPPNPGLRISHHFKTSNGSVSLNSSGEDVIEAGLIPVGTTVTYACNNGVLNGKATRECLEGGKWSGYQPDCVKGCKDPGKPRHSTREAWIGPEATQQEKNLTADILRSTINRSRFPTGTVLQFECVDNNFFLRGIGRRVCMPNGRWSSPVNPRCLPKCGVFPKVVTAARGSRADLPVPESWPWHAVIKRRVHSAGPWTVQCAGAYIGHNIVVTVAQCVTFSSTVLPFQPYEIQVGLGINPSGGILQEHEVNELIVHTDFDPILHDYDIALLVLMSEVRLDPRGQLWPACLSGDPEYKSPRSRSVVIGEKATSSAWTEHHTAYAGSISRAAGDDAPGLSRHSASDAVANTDGNDAPEKKLPVRSDPEKTLKAVNLDIVRASKVITAQDEPTTKPEYSTLNNDSTAVATTQTRELTDDTHGPDKIEHFEVTREISTKCEQVFRETMVASRMICGLQAIFANKGSSTDTQCFERKGSPMVVIRPIRQRNRNRRRRVKARTPKRRRPRCACKSRKTRQARAIADDAYADHVLLYPQHQRAKRAQDHQVELQALDLKDTSSATHVWVLEGLSSWTARGSCRELEVNRYTVYLKVRAFTEWIALKRNELFQKGLLLPPN